jgi:hypothetical protein
MDLLKPLWQAVPPQLQEMESVSQKPGRCPTAGRSFSGNKQSLDLDQRQSKLEAIEINHEKKQLE